MDPQHVVDWVDHHVQDRAQAVYFAGNGFSTAAAVEEVEARIGRLAVAANQALLWGLLAVTGTTWELTGHGRLFR